MIGYNTSALEAGEGGSLSRRNVVVRDVCANNGSKIGIVIEPHDGTEAGMIVAAQQATQRMYAEYPEASNIESRIMATDDSGRPRWCISPNFQHLAEIGTNEARYIWGGGDIFNASSR